MNKKIYLLLPALLFISLHEMNAQVAFSAQIRTRSEFRDGQGTLSTSDAPPAFFTSQRTRVNLGYTAHRLKIYTSIQDVRVWGQDASSINRITTDSYDGLMLHEGWAEFNLVDTGHVVKNFSLKIGRQELVYDDVRLLGNLDWLQQARRHDAALLKFEHDGWTAHAGAAYNQNAERKSGTVYNGVPVGYPASTNGMGSMYKSMQFVYLSRKLRFGNASILAFKDDFSRFSFASTDSLKSTPIYNDKVWSRFTAGGNLFGTAYKKITFALSAFYQGGAYREGTELNEYLLSASLLYAATSKLSIGPGVDITSGNNGTDPSKRFQRFDPLYGTPHKFWGYMDYFYVADTFGPNGLVNYYLKSKFKAKENLMLTADIHRFVLPEPIPSETGSQMNRALGTEIDVVLNYGITKIINIESGFSAMFSTDTMASGKVKNVNGADKVSTWAYVMLSIKPETLLSK
ncbi:MAG: alginate export family protein [Cyclobacteriaceae bacterium]